MTLDALRTCFPHVADQIYVNHAATSPLSRSVMAALEGYAAQRHRTHIDNFEAFLPVVERARERAAHVLGAPTERVAFAQNTSSALDVLARGLDWKRGDRIAVPACEFPANVYPFLNLKRRGVEVDFIPHVESTVSLEAVEQALTPQTRLLSLSWVQFLSGFRMDLEAVGRLCRARGIVFCVDAIQGLGALRLDVEACGIDFLACGAQKWLMGTQGTGLLYCTEALQERLRPAAGWLHGPVDWERFFDYEMAFHPEARRFQIGTANNLGLAALDAALGLYLEAGPAWCERHVLANSRRLAEGLRALGLPRYGTGAAARASGIVTVAPRDPDGLFEHLKENGITAAVRNRKLRFSPTYYNTVGEIDHVLEAVESFETQHVPTR